MFIVWQSVGVDKHVNLCHLRHAPNRFRTLHNRVAWEMPEGIAANWVLLYQRVVNAPDNVVSVRQVLCKFGKGNDVVVVLAFKR